MPLTTREEGGGVREESEKRDRERVRQGSGEIDRELGFNTHPPNRHFYRPDCIYCMRPAGEIFVAPARQRSGCEVRTSRNGHGEAGR